MRPSDSHQPPSARPNLVSVNRKRSGTAGGILDQIDPAGGAGRGFELDARWLVAGCVLVVGLVIAVAGIAYMNATTERILPKADSPRPRIASLPQGAAPSSARIERVAEAGGPPAAPMGFEQAPARGPLPAPATLASMTAGPPATIVGATERGTGAAVPSAATASAATRPVAVPAPRAHAPLALAARPAAQRPARRNAAARGRARPQPALAAPTHEQDPDVELISAIRKATEKAAD